MEGELLMPTPSSPGPDIRDIKDLITLGGGISPWLLVAIIVALVAAGILAYFQFRKAKAPKPVPEVPADKEAMVALDRLAAFSLTDYESIKRFHFELSEISRRFIERRFGVPATDRTLEEILPLLERMRALSPNQRENVAQILKRTDRVKFTDEDPGNARSLELLELTKSFLRQSSIGVGEPHMKAAVEPSAGAEVSGNLIATQKSGGSA
jgi:hypothetical protein